MAIDMKSTGRSLFILAVLVLTCCSNLRAQQSGCDASPNMSARITEFEAQHVSPVEALLRFGAEHRICFGIKYVDVNLLTRPVDVRLRGVTVGDAVLRILNTGLPLRLEQHYGVVEIGLEKRASEKSDIFNYVLPRWEANRGNIQLVSWLLHIQLVTDLSPDTEGFNLHTAVQDPHDDVGPFNEQNMSISSLLDKIVAQSKGAAWVAQVQWGQQGNFSLVTKQRRAWRVVEYGDPSTDYGTVLREVSAELGPSTESPR